ncbi:hypothetical protein [Aquibium sp. ELW1220]|uniref:hypothetical protein n=1 Tax=Aquibium sp. ELW1220 TaxID=2976766 RepID=UPI0025B249AD|nr:hypothetical protein [Aquibium sp. ELW1220]MDN2581876.1 hypothetical protein [Aquibium sp. ELW1220]
MEKSDEFAVRLLCIETLMHCFIRHTTAGGPSFRDFISIVLEEAAQEIEGRSIKRSGYDRKTMLRALDHLEALRFDVIHGVTPGH